MIQNDPNTLNCFYQLQNLLTQLNNYLFQVNQIILEMNNIINTQMNNSFNNKGMNLMNQMNNFMNLNNQINFSDNSLFNKQNLLNTNKTIINASFKCYPSGLNILIPVEENTTIKNLLKLFFQRINRKDLIDNYKDKMSFICDGHNLNEDTKIEEMNHGCVNVTINVIEFNQLIA